ncbi:MAG: SEC-C metal-binding domain-containing protein [Phycisphaerae bacterium]
MFGQYRQEQIENWVGDFCTSDEIQSFASGLREHAPAILVKFLSAACDARDVDPGDIEEPDIKSALLNHIAKLNIPKDVRRKVPALCGGLLEHMESEGRLSDGSLLAAYTRALGSAFDDATSEKAKPIVRAGSRLKRNDPCPCGSGKKYKKCCME